MDEQRKDSAAALLGDVRGLHKLSCTGLSVSLGVEDLVVAIRQVELESALNASGDTLRLRMQDSQKCVFVVVRDCMEWQWGSS